MCRGWEGGNLLYLLCQISNTLPQLDQSSLHPSTVLHHRHLLRRATWYNHLRLLLHLLSTRKEKKPSSNKLGTPLAGGLRSQRGLRPFYPVQSHQLFALWLMIEKTRKLPTEHAEMYEEFVNGKCVVQTHTASFKATSPDKKLEQTINRSQKSSGGIVGQTKADSCDKVGVSIS